MQTDGSSGFLVNDPADRGLLMRPAGPSALTGPISLMPRALSADLSSALDGVAAARLPQFRCECLVADLPDTLQRVLGAFESEPHWLWHWLAADITALGELYAGLTGARRLAVRLEVIDDDGCPRFHTDLVRYRLVTTYRGPGTQWIAPRMAARWAAAAGGPPDQDVRQLDRGWVAILRGDRDAAPDRPGLYHRSPPIEEGGETRLFLAIDDHDDHVWRA